CLVVGEILGSGVGPDAKAAKAMDATGVGEFEGGDSEESFARKAGGDGFRSFNEPFGVRVGSEKCADRIGPPSAGGSGGAQKFEKFLARPDGESVKGMGYNSGVQVIVEVEAERDAPGTGARGVVVRNVRKACRVRVTNCYGRGRFGRVRSAREVRSFGRRDEAARANQALGVSRPKTRMEALQLVEGVEQLLGQRWIGEGAGRQSFF